MYPNVTQGFHMFPRCPRIMLATLCYQGMEIWKNVWSQRWGEGSRGKSREVESVESRWRHLFELPGSFAAGDGAVHTGAVAHRAASIALCAHFKNTRSASGNADTSKQFPQTYRTSFHAVSNLWQNRRDSVNIYPFRLWFFARYQYSNLFDTLLMILMHHSFCKAFGWALRTWCVSPGVIQGPPQDRTLVQWKRPAQVLMQLFHELDVDKSGKATHMDSTTALSLCVCLLVERCPFARMSVTYLRLSFFVFLQIFWSSRGPRVWSACSNGREVCAPAAGPCLEWWPLISTGGRLSLPFDLKPHAWSGESWGWTYLWAQSDWKVAGGKHGVSSDPKANGEKADTRQKAENGHWELW